MTSPADLAEEYRARQVALRAALLYEVAQTWASLDPARLSATAARWVQVMVELVVRFAVEASEQAAEFYERYRRTAVGRGSGLEHAWEPNLEQIRTSLVYTGPTRLAYALRGGADLDEARDTGLVLVSGAAGRLALNAGRELIEQATRDDTDAIGWARVTRAAPCYWCAMLASRGPVYHTRDTAGFAAHDHCVCFPVPVFSRDEPWPGRAREFEQLWSATTGGVPGREKVRAFRRVYEDRAAIPRSDSAAAE